MAETPSAPENQLAELRRLGARGYDPVRFRYLESLTERLASGAHRLHLNSLRQALEQFQTAFLAEKENTEALAERLALQHNADGEALQNLIDNGDFKAVHRLAAWHRRRPSPLSQLVLALQTDEDGKDGPPDDEGTLATLLREQQARLQHFGERSSGGPRRELKAARHLRATQTRLHTEHRIHQSIIGTPDDAGPLNAHRLVTRALERMQDISPAYLNRFAGYMEMLTGLEKVARKT